MRYAIKKPLLSLAFVLVLLSAIALGGCGSVSNGGASDSPAEESLKPADISGYWIVSEADGISLDDTLELGMFSALQFDENGGLKLITHLKDSKVEREGTYEIDGKSLYINIPEAEEQSAGAISISFKAVENAEATIDGDTLTTNGISTKGGETVANKSTDEQYQEYVDRVVALGPKKLAVGETGTTNLATFTIDSLSYVDEVYPFGHLWFLQLLYSSGWQVLLAGKSHLHEHRHRVRLAWICHRSILRNRWKQILR